MTAHLSRRFFLATGLALAATGTAFAGSASIYTDGSGAAASGYDVVAYFTEQRPVDGSDAYTAQYEGATWRFSSAENRDLFIAQPTRYAPQYGGYCAYAVAKGATASTVPEAWKIVDGKLYLNYSTGIKSRWEGQQSEFIATADRNWPGVLK